MLLRPVARPMFASWFVVEGVDAIRHPAAHAATARDGLAALCTRVGRWSAAGGASCPLTGELSERTLTTAVRVHAVAMVGAAGLLALGRAPRTCAAVLAVLTVPVAVVNAPPGRTRDNPPATEPKERAARRRRFWTAVSMAGGALLAAADYEGRPGVRWRVGESHARHDAVRQAVREATTTA